MACPYFHPECPSSELAVAHRERLPLGDAYCGTCSASSAAPDLVTLAENCNVGYARNCRHLPAEREADAVRYSVHEREGQIVVTCIYERNHLPAGVQQYVHEASGGRWICLPEESAIQAQVKAVLNHHLSRTGRAASHAAS